MATTANVHSIKHIPDESAVAVLLSTNEQRSDTKVDKLRMIRLARPFFKSKKHNKNGKSHIETVPALKSARISVEDLKRKSAPPRKVSFSPLVEETKAIRGQINRRANTTEAIDIVHGHANKSDQKINRRASFNDSIGRSNQLRTKARRSSIAWDKNGLHSALTKAKDLEKIPKKHTTKQAVIANHHALALEQIIHAGASLKVNSLEDLKAEREEKTRGKRDKEKLQMIPAVSPRRVQALKKALLDTKTAVGVINELQRLQVKDDCAAITKASTDEKKSADPINVIKEVEASNQERKKTVNHAVKAVCLDCTEEEADQRQQTSAVNLLAVGANAKIPQTARTAPNKVEKLEVELCSSSPTPSLLTGISPVTMVANTASATAAFDAVQVGTFDALATLSGVAVQLADGHTDQDQEVHPPLDRMAAFIRWWGYEITLPPPSLKYLGTARSVSSAVFTILTTMAITGGIPELLPFIRYLSSFVDMEFTAIRSQDKGQGVILAATWLMPMALVPRPWDYPTESDSLLATPTTPELTPMMPGLITNFQEEPEDIPSAT